MSQPIIQQINQVISEAFGVEAEEIQPDNLLLDDFNASEMELTDMISLLEHTLDLSISSSEVNQLQTVNDLYELILDKMNEIG